MLLRRHWLCPCAINWSLANFEIIRLYPKMQRKLIVYPVRFQFIQVNWIFSPDNFQFIWKFFKFIWTIFQSIWIIMKLSGWLWNYLDKNTTIRKQDKIALSQLGVNSLYPGYGQGDKLKAVFLWIVPIHHYVL